MQDVSYQLIYETKLYEQRYRRQSRVDLIGCEWLAPIHMTHHIPPNARRLPMDRYILAKQSDDKPSDTYHTAVQQ